MRDSIFFSSVRSFFVSFFALLGIGLGAVLVIIAAALIVEAAKDEITTDTKTEILPNAKGVRKALSKKAPVILQMDITGMIGMENLNMHAFRQKLIESQEGDFEDGRVKAIFLQINTPGGTVNDSDGIYRLLKEYKEKYQVPVYAYVNGLCASGGMYIASAADKIFASDVSLIGSVGVLSPSFFNVSGLMDKLGINSITASAGKNKDQLNPFRPWKSDESKSVQNIIDYYYRTFVDIVAENRPRLSREKLIKEYGANLFQAPLAKEYGYIDESGMSLSDALSALLDHLGIDSDFYQVVRFEKKGWLANLYENEQSLLKGKVSHEILFSPEFSPALMNKFLYLYKPN